MDTKYLTEEELAVELEIRSMPKGPNKKITEEIKEALTEKWKEEKANLASIPLRAHLNAKKNPKREAIACVRKLESVKQLLLTQDVTKDVDDEILNIMVTKLHHTHGRLVRISSAPVLQKHIIQLLRAYQELIIIVTSIKEKTGTLENKMAAIAAIVTPAIDTTPEEVVAQIVHRTGTIPKVVSPRAGPSTATVVTTEGDGFEVEDRVEEQEASLINSLAQMKIELDERLQAYNFEKGLRRSSTQSRDRTRQDSIVSEDVSDIAEMESMALPLDAKICRDPSTWGLKFEGTRSTTHIERFFYRVERLAVKSKIHLDSLVDYMV